MVWVQLRSSSLPIVRFEDERPTRLGIYVYTKLKSNPIEDVQEKTCEKSGLEVHL